jgi:CubicO group peptidase (beta-lactamase class C family)
MSESDDGNQPPRDIEVHGTVDPAFAPIEDVFARLLAGQQGGGAALAIYRDGVPLVDLWGGDYAEDSLQLVHSVSKVLTAIVVQTLVDDGRLDLDAPIAEAWPAFAKPSTKDITLRQVLTHRSGLPAVARPMSFQDLLGPELETALEQQEPYWEPGTDHGYHGFTLGTFVNGVLRRSLGTSVNEVLQERIAGPLGVDAWIGLPAAELPRVSRIVYDRPARTAIHRRPLEQMIVDGHFAETNADRAVFNSPELLQASWPAVNGVTQARALARILAATMDPVDGVRLVSDRGLAELTTRVSVGMDRVLGVPSAFSTGLQLPFPQLPFLSRTSFGHEAAGGSVAFGDLDSGIAVGFTTNRHWALNGASPSALALIPTIRHLLEA